MTASSEEDDESSNFSILESDVLHSWLSANSEHPYPTDAEKLMFVELTGLTMSQINNWFIHVRKANGTADPATAESIPSTQDVASAVSLQPAAGLGTGTSPRYFIKSTGIMSSSAATRLG
ncbi:hypothetical protein N7481_000124 [Penicillium waksmanii]|uniref:uncharacterized protein n=1 Tax=Penicillium waksmanii TaxID=69791 RepID=UPI002547F9A5|nr:uncharacterized protein N7481_000124 [Penicillium waksmanii]KAJ5999715.1 hypothetical protein N7481_000124 [Penicillium waksmanii]